MQIFLCKTWKKLHISMSSNICKFFCWFIEDIFLLYNRCKVQLLDFITRLNSRHPTVKLNSKYSKSSIDLLETKIYKKKEKNKLLTTMYQKPTDLIIFLDPTSAHPKLLIYSIPFSEALQLEKICSKTSELDKYLNELKES